MQYALSNPISQLVDKPCEEFTREDLISVIEKNGIERITFHYTALDGKLKELKIPIADRYQAERILAEGERVDGSSLFKGMVDAAVSDLYVVPVYKTAFLNPFDAGSLDVICRYLTKDGERAPFALDNVLHRAHDLFRRTGFELCALGELEFFLMTESDSPIFPASKQRGYHASGPFVKSGRILNEMVRHITQITGAVKYAHSEVGFIERVRSDLPEIQGKRAEQLEIEFLPTPIEDAADNLVLSRWIIRNTAYKYGAVATFAPKVEEGHAGNGLHIHMEARKAGRNAMTDEKGLLSETARKIIGGLCTYAQTLTAFGNTVSSAYLRLVPNQEAPTRVCWSDLNRSAMIRVPLGWTSMTNLAGVFNPQQAKAFEDSTGRQTVELRSPDGSAVVHLLLAGIALAAQWGMTHEKEALALADRLYVTGNIFQNRDLLDTLEALPTSCVGSASMLKACRDLYEREGVFPPAIINYVAKLLEAEKDENMNEHLADLPADDRLHETRRIMHRNLHRH
jgi:glutamine synthetase